MPLIERFYRLPSALLARSSGSAGGERTSLSGALAALPAGVPDGFHVRPGDLAACGFGPPGATQSFLGNNYLTVVSVYSLLLLSEVCFWNSFGFDRSAAQIYFLAPVPFSKRADRQEPERAAVHPD